MFAEKVGGDSRVEQCNTTALTAVVIEQNTTRACGLPTNFAHLTFRWGRGLLLTLSGVTGLAPASKRFRRASSRPLWAAQ